MQEEIETPRDDVAEVAPDPDAPNEAEQILLASVASMPQSRWTKSSAEKVTRSLIGPFGRALKRENRCHVGWYVKGAFVPCGSGDTWEEAIRRAFLRGQGVETKTPPDAASEPVAS